MKIIYQNTSPTSSSKSRLERDLDAQFFSRHVRAALRRKLHTVLINYPESWDCRFVTNILSERRYKREKHLSVKQTVQVKRILQDEIFTELLESGCSIEELFETKLSKTTTKFIPKLV